MADLVKFNDPPLQAVDPHAAAHTSESQQEPGYEMQVETERQKENKKEIDKIQEKHNATDDYNKKMEEKMQKAPGNILDASGDVHANVKDEHKNNNSADKWKATALPKEEQVVNTNAPNPQDHLEHRQQANHRPLGEQPIQFNNTFDSTMTELRNIFNTTDEGASINGDHISKLSNPTPLIPVRPDELIKNLQIKAIKYIMVACCICYVIGRFNFGYVFGLCMIGLCSWAYWNLGRITSRGLEWQLEKQESMKTVCMIYIDFLGYQLTANSIVIYFRG